MLVVMPAKAGIQVFKGYRALRARYQNLFAGGSAISFSKSKAAFRRLLIIRYLDVRLRGHDNYFLINSTFSITTSFIGTF
jgi:hypothetical protein